MCKVHGNSLAWRTSDVANVQPTWPPVVGVSIQKIDDIDTCVVRLKLDIRV